MKTEVLCLVVFCSVVSATSTVGYVQSSVSSYNFVARSNNSTLYNLTLSNDPYQYPIYLIDLWGNRTTMGYDYGVLLGNDIVDCYNIFFQNLLDLADIPSYLKPMVKKGLQLFLQSQWDKFLSKQVTSEFIEELNGIELGGNAIGIDNLSDYITQTITLANLPSSISDFKYIVIDEYSSWINEHSGEDLSDSILLELVERAMEKAPSGLQCSMFGVWGSRTVNGELFSARNLDWIPNLGLNQYKCIQLWHPEGANEHAAVGYVVVYGVLAGMSSKGMSVHEANLETEQETFNGFPWLLRLRYIMENSDDISDAWAIWEATNNTIGYNHMITSSKDAANGHGALALETIAGYSAYFLDDDPRESSALYYDESLQEDIPVGFPMEEALWRTNHGYDPKIRKNYAWKGTGALHWSMERYMFAYQAFTYYQNQNIEIDYNAAINITAILGDKGKTAYSCDSYADGSNIVSVTFHPGNQELWAAWENGSGSSWTPAACNNYVHIDLSKWFSQSV